MYQNFKFQQKKLVLFCMILINISRFFIQKQ